MISGSLPSLQSPTLVFRHYVLTNLQYWRDYITARPTDTAALDRARSRIMTGISFALELEEAWPLVRELIETLSPYMERGGYWQSWQWVLSRAVEAAQRVNDVAGSVSLLLLLARLLQRQSDFKLAVARYRQTIRLAGQVGDKFNKARACSNLGFLYTELGHWWRAKILCCYALAIFEQFNSAHGRAHTENHLGILYIWQNHWESARQHLERACEIWQDMGDNYGLLYGLINLGSLNDDMERPDQALFYLEKALELAKLVGEEVQMANIYMNMSIAYRVKGELDTAATYIWRAEAIFRRFVNLVGMAQIQDNLGLIYLYQGKWSEAKSYLCSAFAAWDGLGNDYGKIRNLSYLVEYELVKGDRRQAARQLAEIERLISSPGKQGDHWQSLLTRCRRSLSEPATSNAAAD
ncbi:MAG: tetratricopeptide repeat protein [Anaerolineaceae bacterium]|nr:tetratricopeptide repeat protein [Anaerolineaceae bacterium]MCB9100859.1 tetratricopeptide repeat protein [Anaerolineales bacterium]